MEPGDLFGEMPLFDGLGRSAEARALEPSTVIEIPYAPVMALYEENPAELWAVVRLLASRLRSMDESLADSVFLDVTGRTAKRLLELADDSDEFTLPITQEELAGMVGASRERSTRQSPRSCGSDGSSRTIGATSSPTANSFDPQPLARADRSNRDRRCERGGTQEFETVDLNIGTPRHDRPPEPHSRRLVKAPIEVTHMAQLASQPDLADRHDIVAKRLTGQR